MNQTGLAGGSSVCGEEERVERRFGTTSDSGRRSTKISGESRNSENDLICAHSPYPNPMNSTYYLYLESCQIAIHWNSMRLPYNLITSKVNKHQSRFSRKRDDGGGR